MGRSAEKTDSATAGRSAHPTIATIAAHLGLSRATVTHVLNGRAAEQRISSETQRRVLEAAREMGYRPNASARAVRAGRFGNIALVQSLRGAYLPPELLYGVTTAVAARNLHVALTQVADAVEDDGAYLPHTMRELSADGILINQHAGFSQPFLEQIRRARIPAVSLNVRQEFDCIHPDEARGGRVATEFLLGLGHERIAYVDTDEPGNRHFSKPDRRAGHERAMASAGLPPRVHLLPKDWRMPGRAGVDARVESARALLVGEDRPTAALAYEMAEAMALVHAAHLLGLRVPEDLSIAVFHNALDDRPFRPFHTMSNAMLALGTGAVDMLLEKIESPDIPLPARVVPGTLLNGATCMPPHRRTTANVAGG